MLYDTHAALQGAGFISQMTVYVFTTGGHSTDLLGLFFLFYLFFLFFLGEGGVRVFMKDVKFCNFMGGFCRLQGEFNSNVKRLIVIC